MEDVGQTVPGSVQGLLQSRIDRLTAPVRLAAQMASILGAQFPVGLLHRMYALDPQPMTFDAALATLEERGFVERTDTDDVRRFRHALMQEVAYGGILSRLRKVLHESAAELGEEHYADRLDAEASFFAHHYWQAELRERAAPHLYRAAMGAAARYDLPSAERWFGQLAEAEAEHPGVLAEASDRAAMMIHYGAVLLDRGRYDPADNVFVKLEELGSASGRSDWVGQALRYRGQIAALRGRLADSRVLFESGLERLPAEEKRLTADLRTGLGLVLYYGSDGDGALAQFETARRLYEEVSDRLGQAKCYINIGNVMDDLRNDRAAAEPSYLRALELIEEVGDRRLKTGVLLNLGTLAWGRGDWEDALTRFLHVETVAEELGWSFMRFLSLQNQASCNLSLGRIASSLSLLETCLREGEGTMRGDDRIRVRRLLFEVHLACLDRERAAGRLEEARAVAAEIEMDELDDELRLDEGRLSAANGEWTAAARAFREAIETAERLGHPVIMPVARAHRFRAAVRAGLDEDAPVLGEIPQPPTRALVTYLIADAEAWRSSSEDAAGALEEAGELAGELGFLALERAAFERAAETWGRIGDEEARDRALRRAAIAMASLEANLPTELRDAFSSHPRNESLRTLVPA
jgi:tetratricopeptide (TPR) repeat protein